jgi:hypothetical protein
VKSAHFSFLSHSTLEWPFHLTDDCSALLCSSSLPRKTANLSLVLVSPTSFYSTPPPRLFSAASSDSIRFHSNLLSHDNDLRVSIDNTCTDSLVTALDDEALLINDYMNDMSKSKVRIPDSRGPLRDTY